MYWKIHYNVIVSHIIYRLEKFEFLIPFSNSLKNYYAVGPQGICVFLKVESLPASKLR